MPRKTPFKHHRFPKSSILCAVRWYLRYPLSYQDDVDLLGEREISVDRSTVYRWVQKFGPELTKRTEKHLRRASVDWHVDETYIRVGGKWRSLWRAVDANGPLSVHCDAMPCRAADDRLPPHCAAGCEGGQGLSRQGDRARPSA